jgi:hypothetical protein
VIEDPNARPSLGASFCIPRAAITALIEAQSDAVMIVAYLTLACFTEATGQYSTANQFAVRRYTSTNLDRAKKAIARLSTIKVKAKAGDKKSVALLYARDAWIAATNEELPDGPFERAMIRHVLPCFGEEPGERVWFSRNLVEGTGSFEWPLKRLKNLGDPAARLFLLLQQAVDMGGWLAVPPAAGPWVRYETVMDKTVKSSRIIHGQHQGDVMWSTWIEAYGFEALHSLVDSGFFYEVVMALNRKPVTAKFGNGTGEYGNVPPDAEPLYELDTRSQHGFKPQGEEGLAGLTAKTAGEAGAPVTGGRPDRTLPNGYDMAVIAGDNVAPGAFSGKYAAIVPRGQPAMIAGVYRPRFRVSNTKNAGVKDAWLRIHENQRDGRQWIEQLRTALQLKPLPATDRPPARDKPRTGAKSIH